MNLRARATRLTTLTAAVALAFTGGLALPAHAAGPSSVIANDTAWTDTDGNEILAQGGNVLKVGSIYYWVGQKLVSGQPKTINLYSSTDLENWTYEGPVLSQSGSEGPLAEGLWLGRPQLIRNPDGKFVLVVEVNDGDRNRNQILFATSPTIDGTYTPTGPAKEINGNTTGDHSVFVDGDKAYLVYVGDTGRGDAKSFNVTLNVAPLTGDWTGVGPAVYSESYAHKEAPAIVKDNGTYYLFASGMDYWDATATSYRASSTLGGWDKAAPWSTVATRPSSDNSFGTQFEQIIPVVGSKGTSYLYNGDRYSQFYKPGGSPAPGGIGRNAWYPLTFEGSGPVLHGYTDVDVDAAAGTITGNRVANGRFDQDIAGTRVPQWKVTGPGKVEESTLGDGRRQLAVWDDAAYTSWISQEVALPNGSYELSFDYRSSGGQKSAYVEVKGHGGSAVPVHLTAKQDTWATKKLTFTVSSGKVNLGIWSDSPAGKWLNIDNVSIWSAG
ncbi:Glycosyl hydrolases family 43 [Streptomyces sp. ADI96-02]|uniref:family 43 glycosylhydrolase n=1 Tax=Streptomyces sp. ADI96-02 TaxID=1522760 RepID=UPI000F9A82C2|nr:family 43 glycosylhydrolase [Streptomyces sp. ADI96-02]RPK55086.1 Glycosyl hydrolases family 43 [Streptomyces sp. ADI96-02]